MNAFDLIITVSFGSSLATILLSNSVSLIEGVLVFILLITFQYAVALISVKIPGAGKYIKAEPRFLFRNGEVFSDALKQERIRRDELLQAIRNQGFKSLDQVDSVILETNGSFSIVKKASDQNWSALENVV
jgi:uncharacterized membrane protein YcaP (DUF421 family)